MITMNQSAKHTFLSAMLAIQLIPLLASPAMAANQNVKIAGHVVIVNKAGAAGQSVDAHTASIQQNLDNALSSASDISPSSVKVVKVKGVPVITVGGYKIVTVDGTNAKLAKTTQLALANKWAASLRRELANTEEVQNYIADLSGGGTSDAEPAVAPSRSTAQTVSQSSAQAPMTAPGQVPPTMSGTVQQNTMLGAAGAQPPYQGNPNLSGGAGYQANVAGLPPMQGRVIYAPAGMTVPITLTTSISSAAAQAGDVIQATISQDLNLGNGVIPAGSTIEGIVTDAEPGRRLDRSGSLSIKFTTLRMPDGTGAPIVAHLIGSIGKYADKGGETADTARGETLKNKVESAAIRGAVGAGTGAALGTAVGAIAGGGHGVGKGAWSGTAIGAGVGVADSLLLRKAADVVLKSGTNMQLQLDQPIQIACPPGQPQ